MKKKVLTIVVLLISVLMLGLMVACSEETPNTELLKFEGITFEDMTVDYDGNVHTLTCKGVPEGATVNYTNNSGKEDGVYNAKAVVSNEGYETATFNAKLTIVLKAQRIVDARQNSLNETNQNYDFSINLNGTIQNISANANYDGYYRYNTNTNELAFKRVTSGVLLYDSIEYIYNTGSSKVKLTANEDGEIKKSSIVPQEDEELNLLNIPFSAVVNHLEANNLSDITKINGNGYQYKATMKLASENTYIKKIFSMVEKMGSKIEIKEISLSNPAAGIDFYFNMNENKTLLTGFKYEIKVSFPVKNVPVSITLSYLQKDNDSTVAIPSTAGLVTTTEGISTEIGKINTAINELKNSETYSLDLVAKNDLDAGLTSNAVVDKYIARMYKNTNDDRVDFNHSYEYKAHSEEDGAETYKYTIGNIQDGSVHEVSRKGSNVINELNGVTVDTQFDYLVGTAMISASDVDCISKEEKDGSTFYYIYVKTNKTLSIKDEITEIINSNEAEGVLDVNNYFNNSEYEIKDAEIIIEMKNGKIVNISITTKISYVSTGGEYSGEKVLLTNSIELAVNEKIDDASEYEAPKKTETSIGGFGLNNAKYYIG